MAIHTMAIQPPDQSLPSEFSRPSSQDTLAELSPEHFLLRWTNHTAYCIDHNHFQPLLLRAKVHVI